MIGRISLLAFALLSTAAIAADERDAVLATPVLRAEVVVSSDVVRIGDLIDHAGPAASIAVYRSPDLGTAGVLPAAKIIAALRAHQVIGVDTRDIREVSISRAARTIEADEIERQVARVLEHSHSRGDAASFAIKFDGELRTVTLEPTYSGKLDPIAVRFDQRSGRFDITFDVAQDGAAAPRRLRFTGVAQETIDAAVLIRSLERNEIVKASDIAIERRPKQEVGDAAGRDAVIGMQARRSLRAGQALRPADLGKPDLVQRDQTIVLIYETAGLYLTGRGKALDTGAEGDAVTVLNIQSKRVVTGTVTGRGQVTVSVPAPRVVASAAAPARSSNAAE